MQNRYVGDVGDFAKYALLRRLAGSLEERPIRLGIVWCLYPDESHNSDGSHVSYLRRPEFAEPGRGGNGEPVCASCLGTAGDGDAEGAASLDCISDFVGDCGRWVGGGSECWGERLYCVKGVVPLAADGWTEII